MVETETLLRRPRDRCVLPLYKWASREPLCKGKGQCLVSYRQSDNDGGMKRRERCGEVQKGRGSEVKKTSQC